VIWKKK
jgi:hypothetical protein